MKNKLFRIILPTLIAILIRIVWEFVFGFNLHSSNGWSVLLGMVAVFWAIATIIIVIHEIYN